MAGLPNMNSERTVQDVQRTSFVKEQLEKEAEKYGLNAGDKGLSQQHLDILHRIHAIDKDPYPIVYPGSLRTEEQIAESHGLHKRVNPGYVDMPYKSTNQEHFKYLPPPDFSKAYLKKRSDCDFQGFASEAILKHVDLKKTSH